MRKGISPDHIEKMLNLIKTVGERFTDYPQVVKTEVEVKYNKEHDYFEIHPTFFITGRMANFNLMKHVLAGYVEDYLGVPVHAASMKIKKYDDI